MQLSFEAIELAGQTEYLAALQKCSQPTSDYSFVNVWGWQSEYGLRWARGHNLTWLHQTLPEPVCWAPIGAWEEVDWGSVMETVGTKGTTFVRVPERLEAIWREALGERIQSKEERGDWDYLYDANALISLKGNRFHKKKNLLNQFLRNYEYTYVPMGAEAISKALEMQENWCAWRDCESLDTLAAENRAIQRVLSDWDRLEGLMGGALMVGSYMAAYTVAEKLSDDMVVIHFEKGDPSFKGIYQAINQMFLEANEGAFAVVNREQDLGDEGLRKAKLSYHPTGFLKKYRVTIV